MKKVVLLSIVVMFFTITAYQPQEHGLFYTHSGLIGSAYKQIGEIYVYEKRIDGTNSNVLCVNGVTQFHDYVLKASLKNPIIVKVQDSLSVDAPKTTSLFQELADNLNQLNFVSVDIIAECNGQPENSQILANIMQEEHCSRLDLPIFLFFKDGKLYKTEKIQTGILQGFYTKENLTHTLKSLFSLPKQPFSKQKTWWQRLKELFKKKQ
jgi:anaerobic glycerol-3-phosphate dehydrogenase